MDKLILFVIVVGIVLAAAKVRMDAARDRKETVQRISADHEARESLSPTADLFRDSGVPIPDELAPSATVEGAPPAPAMAPAADLATIFEGIHLPVGLSPIDAGDPHRMTLQSLADPVTVRSALDDELHQMGAAVMWDEDGHGEVHKNGGRVTVRIEAAPDLDAATGVISRVHLESI